MPHFDEPDAEWTDEYAWTRFRGPQPYPVPGDWVLNDVEADGIGWRYYEEIGDDHESDHDVSEALDFEEYEERLNAAPMAILRNEIVEDDPANRETTLKQELTIDGETVFSHVAPDEDDLFRVVAEALAQYDEHEDVDEIDVAFRTGRLPAEVQKEQRLERAREENQSIDEFAGGDE